MTIHQIDKIKQSKRRTEEVKFAVGMIVRHSCIFSYHFEDSWDITYRKKVNHDGVIVGWQHKCYRIKFERGLNYRLHSTLHVHFCLCEESSDSAYQPHYEILLENDKLCYVHQSMKFLTAFLINYVSSIIFHSYSVKYIIFFFISDVLSICPKPINNVDIGQYFSRFEGTYYVPNESLTEYYPNDIAAIPKILSNQ